MSTFY